MSQAPIRLRGARQHNLKNLDVDIRTGELTVVTGPSGSGKSSLVFDTLYAEGQRRYVETFSAYARQFLDRMDKPAVDKVEGVPPAIAIDQTNPVRSSRSTVGTMTELNDHLKLLLARAGALFDADTALPVRHDSPDSIYAELLRRSAQMQHPRVAITFAVQLPARTTAEEVQQWLSASGFTRVQAEREETAPDGSAHKVLDVVADRFRLGAAERARVIEAVELALQRGSGQMTAYVLPEEGEPLLWKFSTGLHCPESGRRYAEPVPAMFSFNSAVGACPHCRGFGRVIGVDWGLVVPDERLTLRAGCIKPIQTPAWKECQDDLMRHAESAGIPRDTPWSKLTPEQRHWVIEGTPHFKEGNWNKQWYGIRRFFQYLESKAYKMHIRVLLSKYRSYTTCPVCAGARLKTESLLWRVGTQADADAVLPAQHRFMPQGVQWSAAQLQGLPGLCLHDLMQLPIERLRRFIERLQAATPAPAPGATPDADAQARRLILEEIATRLKYLTDVGLGYLTLDRQSRTLSGGEVQRINLTTALGTSLVNTLFVLDEPSIGLHPRDMDRITQAMQRLKSAGNTLVVVEHDPAVMLAADRVLDFGPGPGAAGGRIVFDGTPEALKQADTLTGAYLGGRKRIGLPHARPVQASTPRLILEGARQHNLQNLTVEFPLQRLVTVTGVSGSGKSTLIQDVLAPALMRHFGQATEAPGAHDRLLGVDHLSGVMFVDQSPIGKTARSNPVSYVGAWDAIRKLFADAPLARQRGYTAAKFSFNSGDGRCPTCGGSGFEHVEMQFLSDVYLRCPDCDGQRYRPEVLQVRIERAGRSLNVAEVLALTVAEAVQCFAQDKEVIRALQPIVDVGLDYVALGQPVPTLSGGEAQRLKLAGHLAEAAQAASKSQQTLARKGTLFLFDEPTTGLHFDDIAKLMRAFAKLLQAGHSLIVIEHNLDVMAASDWLIDLGPEGGDAGGTLVAQGTPDQVAAHPTSHTGAALRDYAAQTTAQTDVQPAMPTAAPQVAEPRAAYHVPAATAAAAEEGRIDIRNAREHNLKNLSVQIPRGQFNVITGVSGSGKSTLAFDILFGEGQRRYLESLNAYARSIVQPAGRPDVDAVYGIPPTVAIEQRLSRGGRKSTVGTATEVWHFLRLLYVKLGVQHCVHDGAAVQPQTPEQMAAQILRHYAGQTIGLLAPLVVGRKGVYTELADWARPRGFTHLRVDGEFLPTQGFPRIDRFKEHTIELPVASLHVAPEAEAELRAQLARTLEHGKGVAHVLHGIQALASAMQAGRSTVGIGQVQVFSTHRACPVCATSYAELDPRLFSYNSKHGWCPDCVGTGLKLTREQRRALDDSVLADDQKGREQGFAEVEVDGLSSAACPSCGGTRLNPTARAVRFEGRAITDLARLSVRDLRQWLGGLRLQGRQADIARDLLPEIESRLAFLEQVGLGYLTLERGAPTLSGGEAQRIRLAAQLGSNLQGVCYVLDEPTIGLHAR
ncbi:MAG: excinuclease ABC subunit UvrA, partial [Pseudomonadota bacterium]|nr:excinuclease ABC subunit UvrA [Pseudomonadota bacterium]